MIGFLLLQNTIISLIFIKWRLVRTKQLMITLAYPIFLILYLSTIVQITMQYSLRILAD